MIKLSRGAFAVGFVILAMLLGAWTAPMSSKARFDATPAPSTDSETHPNVPDKVQAPDLISDKGSLKLSGMLADIPGAQERVDKISAFKMDFGAVSKSNVSEMDKEFISDSLTSNSLELWTIQYSMDKVSDPDLKAFLNMMLAMHSADQKTVVTLAKQLGIDTSVDFTSASTYPETPEYDLGIREENLKQQYLEHLVEPAGASFDDISLSILDQEHASDIQGELAAERETSNPAIKALTKHSADVTALHMAMMDTLTNKISNKFDEATKPDFKESYQSPMQITVEGKSNR